MLARQAMQRQQMQAPAGMIGSAAPKKRGGIWSDIQADPLAFILGGPGGAAYSANRRAEAEQKAQFEQKISTLPQEQQMMARYAPDSFFNLQAENRAPVRMGPGDVLARPNEQGDYESAFSVPASAAGDNGQQLKAGGNGNWWKFNPNTGDFGDTLVKAPAGMTNGSTGAFGREIDRETGEILTLMRDGTVKGTGKFAYIPQTITQVGGVPMGVDKRTLETTPLAGASVGDVAYNKAAGASAEKQGTMQGEAAFNLPLVESNVRTMLDSIGALKSDPALADRYGNPGSYFPPITGTEGARVQSRINMVKGQVFLDAFNSLRGGGQITEIEGIKAEQAKSRLQDQHLSREDAIAAANELIDIVNRGLSVARKRATMAPTLPSRPGGAPAASVEDLLKMYGD